MKLHEKFLRRIENGEPIYDNVKFAKDLEAIANKHFEQLRIAGVSGSALSEAILIMENLMAYGRIHTVKGVRYVECSHEEILDKAEQWLNKVRKNYR